jgi:predicted branched-subunit amino acid permease
MDELGEKIDQLSNQLTELRMELWTEYTLFTWQWWMLVFICILFLVLLFLFVKKEQALSTAAYLGIVYIINKNIDDVATAQDWYDYRIQLEPIIPTMLPANLFIIPLGFSILYTRFERWKSFLISTVIFAGFISFVALPLMKMAEIYLEKSWNSFLSFIILLATTILCKIIIDSLRLNYKRTS